MHLSVPLLVLKQCDKGVKSQALLEYKQWHTYINERPKSDRVYMRGGGTTQKELCRDGN